MKHDHKLKLQKNILQTCIRAVNARCNHQMPTSIFGEIKQDLQLQAMTPNLQYLGMFVKLFI